MKNFLLNLLAEDSKVSAMRLMSLTCVFSATGLAFYGINKGQPLDALSILCGVFLGAAFTGKVSQKFAEGKKNEKTDSSVE